MTREARAAHNHIFQAVGVRDAQAYVEDGCAACRLIRPEVMTVQVAMMMKYGQWEV